MVQSRDSSEMVTTERFGTLIGCNYGGIEAPQLSKLLKVKISKHKPNEAVCKWCGYNQQSSPYLQKECKDFNTFMI